MNLRRPPTSAIVYAGLAIALSLSAAVSMAAYARHLGVTRPDVGPPMSVVVATTPLVRGTVLDADDVGVVDTPSALAPPGSVGAVDEAEGRVLVADIAEGEILTVTRLARAGAGPLSALVPAGLRAFSLPTSVASGSLVPGDLIDVIGTFGANGGRPYTDTVATALEVVRVWPASGAGAAGTSAGGAPAGSVTVLADPDTVEALARAASTGIVTVAIAGTDDAVFAGA